MSTLEDKLLGEKKEYYCSSSESEAESGDEEKDSPVQPTSSIRAPSPETDPGGSTNTGPKGVIKDWQKFRQLEAEKREEKDREKLALLKKLSLTCRSALDEERDKEEDTELAELLSDEFLMEYSKHRMQEMLQRANQLPRFGTLIHLEVQQSFLDAIDKENPAVTVIIHIYEDKVRDCQSMNYCLTQLCVDYPDVKFCSITASVAGVSKHFKNKGVPALLVYKGGSMVGNYVKLGEELGQDFSPNDVENFLIENGMLADRSCIPKIIKGSQT